MPPYYGTTLRSTRIPDDLWAAAKAVAEQRGDTIADVIRKALADYVAQSAPPTVEKTP